MTQAEYNAKVQEIQAMWPGDAHRVEKSYIDKGERTETIQTAWFQVYWDGRWQTLGTQRRPFQPDTEYEWDEDKAMKLRGQFADALSRS